MAWVNARNVIQRLRPAFTLAVTTDSTLAAGLPPYKGKIGKRREEADARAALAAKEAATKAVQEMPRAAPLASLPRVNVATLGHA